MPQRGHGPARARLEHAMQSEMCKSESQAPFLSTDILTCLWVLMAEHPRLPLLKGQRPPAPVWLSPQFHKPVGSGTAPQLPGEPPGPVDSHCSRISTPTNFSKSQSIAVNVNTYLLYTRLSDLSILIIMTEIYIELAPRALYISSPRPLSDPMSSMIIYLPLTT